MNFAQHGDTIFHNPEMYVCFFFAFREMTLASAPSHFDEQYVEEKGLGCGYTN